MLESIGEFINFHGLKYFLLKHRNTGSPALIYRNTTEVNFLVKGHYKPNQENIRQNTSAFLLRCTGFEHMHESRRW